LNEAKADLKAANKAETVAENWFLNWKASWMCINHLIKLKFKNLSGVNYFVRMTTITLAGFS